MKRVAEQRQRARDDAENELQHSKHSNNHCHEDQHTLVFARFDLLNDIPIVSRDRRTRSTEVCRLTPATAQQKRTWCLALYCHCVHTCDPPFSERVRRVSCAGARDYDANLPPDFRWRLIRTEYTTATVASRMSMCVRVAVPSVVMSVAAVVVGISFNGIFTEQRHLLAASTGITDTCIPLR
jgi:hypothetical protein